MSIANTILTPVPRPQSLCSRWVRPRVFVWAVAVLLGLAAGSAWAQDQAKAPREEAVRVTGVSGIAEGAEVSGGVWIEAQVTGHPERVELRLSGPRDFVGVRDAQPYALMTVPDMPAGSKARQMFVSAEGLELEAMSSEAQRIASRTPAVWDTFDWPAGGYVLQVVAFDAGGEADSQTVNFSVTRGQTQGYLVDGVRLPTVAFEDAVTSLRPGRMSSLGVRVTGQVPEGGELLASARPAGGGAWVDEFTHALTGPPYRIDADRLELLPPGPTVLQVITRVNGRVKQVTRLEVEVEEAARSVVAEPRGPAGDGQAIAEDVALADRGDGVVLPTVRFPVGTPRSVEVGGQSVAMVLEVLGAMPEGADVLMEAYSVRERRVVPEFRHVLTGPPWRVSPAKLAGLPTGPVQVRAQVRVGSKLRLTVPHLVMVSKYGSPDTAPGYLGLIETAGEVARAERVAAEIIHAERDKAEAAEATEPGREALPTEPDPNHPKDNATPVPPPIHVAFASGAPDRYELGSDAVVRYTLDGELPAPYRLVVSAKVGRTGEDVAEFRHELPARTGVVDNARLDLLPPGPAVLSVAITGPSSTRVGDLGEARHLLAITAVAAEADADTDADTDTPTHSDAASSGDTIRLEADPADPAARPVWRDPARVVDGWTDFKPSSDSRIIYVSSSTGSDSNSGLTPGEPVKTIDRGKSLLRDDHADWLLFKAGDTWKTGLGSWSLSGRSPQEPMVVGTYGGIARAHFNTNGDGFLTHGPLQVKNVAFVSLHATANLRDPNAPQYDDEGSTQAGIRWLAPRETILFEDVLLEYFHTGVILQNTTGQMHKMRDITFRRCVVRDSYSSGSGHSQGIYAAKMSGLRLEECVIDHNGHYPGIAAAGATIFNHNIYVSQCENFAAVGNVISRASSFGIKVRSDDTAGFLGVTIKKNLFIANTNGITIGGNRKATTKDWEPLTTQHIVISGNVFTRLGGDLASGPQAMGIDLLSVKDCRVDDNLFIDKPFEGNTFAVRVGGGKPQIDLQIRGNVVFGFVGGGMVIKSDAATVSGNLIEPNSSVFMDPQRTVDTYCATLGVPNANTRVLLERCRAISKGTWRAEVAGPAIVRYLRNGFELVPHD